MANSLRGTHADFFTTQNPFLLALWTFGDDPTLPDPIVGQPVISGVLKDSSPRGRDWAPKATLTSNSYTIVSGLPSYGGSGVKFNTIPEVSGADHRYSMLTLGTCQVGNQGNFSPADRNSMSGFTVAGWIQLPAYTADNGVRNLIGSYTQTLPNALGWAVLWAPQTSTLSFRFLGNNISVGTSNSTNVVQVNALQFPTSPTGAIFFACTYEQRHPNFGGAATGSGLASIYIGSQSSGITLAVQSGFNGSDVRMTVVNGSVFPDDNYALGADARQTHGASLTYNVPSGTVFDDFSVWAVKLSIPQLDYLKNFGVNRVDKSTPTTVGTTSLLGLWKFEDMSGINSAPATTGNYNFAHFGDATTIAGKVGNACRLNAATNNTVGNLTSNVGSILPKDSGINVFFPGNVNDPGGDFTYIFWMKDVAENGAGVNWVNSSSSTRQGVRLDHDTTNDILHSRFEWRPSGITATTATSNAAEGGRYFAQKTNNWHLYAIVYDFQNGTTYMVRDARFIIGSAIDMHPSGMNKSVSTTGGSLTGGLKLQIDNTAQVAFDEFAIYNKVLTLNEMSGYAVAGTGQVETQPNTDFFNSNIRLLGYWKLDNFTSYGDSLLRFDDNSYYKHHLTSFSGNIGIATQFKNEVGSGSLGVLESGAFISLPRSFHGANLDFSQREVWTSGFMAGIMLSVPSTTQLDRDYAIMGAWSQSQTERSWLLGAAIPSGGIGPTKLSAKVVVSGITYEASGAFNLPTNTSFFVGMSLTPSGSNGYSALELYYSENDITTPVRLVAYVVVSGQNISPCSASGFSILGVENMQMGWPTSTKAQGPFIFARNIGTSGLTNIKNSTGYIGNHPLVSGGVSSTDSANIDHWTFDENISRQLDFGRAQNHLFKIGTVDTIPAIHLNGAEVTTESWVQNTTTDDRVPLSGLDLGSSTSFTILGWIRPGIGNGQERFVLNKGGAASGYQIKTTVDGYYSFIGNDVGMSGNNSLVRDGEFQHFALVHNRLESSTAIIINGRYAGASFIRPYSILPNLSGFILGGLGSDTSNPVEGGGNFSGLLDDWMVFNRALTLQEISGLAANSYVFQQSAASVNDLMGAYISGLMPNIVSGLLGGFIWGYSSISGTWGGSISGISGVVTDVGGYIHGSMPISGFVGGYTYGLGNISGVFGAYIPGYSNISGFIGSLILGGQEANGTFDATFIFSIVATKDFDARLIAELTQNKEFDASIGVIRITQPPRSLIILPVNHTILSGLPQTVIVTGSGISLNNKELSKVRFTFADFKGAELGVLISGIPNSGLYRATRVFDTPGYYTIKMEVTDEFGYRSSDIRPLLILPSGQTSGQYLNSLPGTTITSNITTGATIQPVSITCSLSGITTTSGLIDYLDFADEQETLVNSTEMPASNIFTPGVRQHSYTMPGDYNVVWAVSGSWGIVSDTINPGADHL